MITCVQTPCMTSRHRNPATLLVSEYNKPGKPACDSCARWVFDLDTSGTASLAPLDGYTDLFAEAKQALHATPGQVIRGEPVTPLRQTWDTGEPVIAPARREYVRLSEGPQPHPAGSRPEARRSTAATWWTAGIASLASLALGIVLCSESVHMEKSVLTIWGVLFIALPFLAAAVALVAWFIRATAPDRQRYRAWKASLSPADLAKVQLAEAAAMAAGAYAVHEGLKHHNERSAAHLAAMRGSMQDTQDRIQQNQDRWAQQAQQAQQIGPYHTGPGPTQHSDIFGNLI